jgi:hypothetical protein
MPINDSIRRDTDTANRQLGYLWSIDNGDWPNRSREGYWIKHPITKITAKRVFIANEPIKRGRYYWKEDLRRHRFFDREYLEKGGRAWGGYDDNWFYTDNGRVLFEAKHPNWRAERAEEARRHAEFERLVRDAFFGTTFPLLQLTTPFSRDDVTRRFRQRALELHPDHGGNAAEFQQLVMERDRAFNLCTERNHGTIWAD